MANLRGCSEEAVYGAWLGTLRLETLQMIDRLTSAASSEHRAFCILSSPSATHTIQEPQAHNPSASSSSLSRSVLVTNTDTGRAGCAYSPVGIMVALENEL